MLLNIHFAFVLLVVGFPSFSSLLSFKDSIFVHFLTFLARADQPFGVM